MKYLRRILFSLMFVWPLLLLSDATTSAKVVMLELEGPIGPASADYFHRGLQKASEGAAALVVLRVDTPGGLDLSMRKIIQDILASPVPVAAFVAPSGSRAASAGTFILYASHIAAMAPATNLGAATPVRIGGSPGTPTPEKPGKPGEKDKAPAGDAMEKKILNDSIAYIKSLATLRGRNVKWAEKAVREGASLPATEAVKMNVVDLMAQDVNDLLKKIDGRTVSVAGRDRVLKTAGLAIERIEPDWRSKLLSIITNPTVIPTLMMLGVLGLLYELYNPGFVFPGVIGGISLLLGLYAVQVLPVNYAGLALILLGIAFMVAEAFAPSFGALGIGGVIAFVAGSIMLIDTDVEGYEIYWPVVVSVAVMGAVLSASVGGFALKARKRQVVSGREEMIGSVGTTLEAFGKQGRVRVHSEEWQARTGTPLKRGQQIRVTGLEGLVLVVEPLQMEES